MKMLSKQLGFSLNSTGHAAKGTLQTAACDRMLSGAYLELIAFTQNGPNIGYSVKTDLADM